MFGDANKVAIPKSVFDVVYLDPMFPVRQKTAKTKKHMQLLKMLVPHNPAIDSLLLEYARSLNSKKNNCEATPARTVLGKSKAYKPNHGQK